LGDLAGQCCLGLRDVEGSLRPLCRVRSISARGAGLVCKSSFSLSAQAYRYKGCRVRSTLDPRRKTRTHNRKPKNISREKQCPHG
jgi:hypothetical protein